MIKSLSHSCCSREEAVLQVVVLTLVIFCNFQITFVANHVLFSSFPFLAFPSLLSREEIQTFPGLLHKGFHIYFLLFCELFTLEYNFERNLEERGLLWSKVLIGMGIEDRARSFSEVSGLFIHRVIQKFSWIHGWYRGSHIWSSGSFISEHKVIQQDISF